VPIHYVHADGWLVGRTGPGAKLAALRRQPWVAFEVDEVDDTFDWRSVLMRGTVYLLAREGPAAERARWERAVALLREMVPGALTDDDLTPERATAFRMHVGELTRPWRGRTDNTLRHLTRRVIVCP
jgi:nitroimidazol reductase NimA-like FMN-containing flavoprotein (pyridoxamine 5'-phosphate oxidase superfamily)